MNDLDIRKLENKITFLERHVEEQDKEMLRMNSELAAVAKGLADLRDRIESRFEANKESSEDQRPPHY